MAICSFYFSQAFPIPIAKLLAISDFSGELIIDLTISSFKSAFDALLVFFNARRKDAVTPGCHTASISFFSSSERHRGLLMAVLTWRACFTAGYNLDVPTNPSPTHDEASAQTSLGQIHTKMRSHLEIIPWCSVCVSADSADPGGKRSHAV